MWIEDEEELPRRPRRRLLAPLPLALLAILLIACGFIGGALVEKGQQSSSSAGGLSSRFAALRSATSATAAGSVASAGSSARGFAAGGGFGGAGLTTGEVAYIVGSTLYVTNSEGTTIRVNTSGGSTVTKTVKSTVSAIHPGETVVVTGSTGKNGAISAESIKIGSTSGGLGSLFGGERSSAGGKGTGAQGGSEQSLFGRG